MALTGICCWKCGKSDLDPLSRISREFIGAYLSSQFKLPNWTNSSDVERYINDMTEREELFATYFAKANKFLGEVDNPNLSFEELENWIKEQENICLQGKAFLVAGTEHKKKRVEKLDKSERDKLISKPDLSVTDAISAVQRRRDRMSKADKLDAYLKTIMTDEDRKKVMGNVKVDESRQQVVNSWNGQVTEERKRELRTNPEPIQETPSNNSDGANGAEPFDPSKLWS